eukprot:5216065-Prymnesium_polylepis.1
MASCSASGRRASPARLRTRLLSHVTPSVNAGRRIDRVRRYATGTDPVRGRPRQAARGRARPREAVQGRGTGRPRPQGRGRPREQVSINGDERYLLTFFKKP